MKAFIYKTEVCDSVLDSIHNFKYYIKEVYIPEKNIVFNEKGYVFLGDGKPRSNDVYEYEIDKWVVHSLEHYINAQKAIQICVKNVFSLGDNNEKNN